MHSVTSYLEPQDPEFAARRRSHLHREYIQGRRRSKALPRAPYTHLRFVSGGLPSLGRHGR